MTVEQSVTVPDIGKRMAEAGHLAAELRLLAVEAKDREDGSAAHVLLQSAGFLDMIATALSARDRLLAEAREALELAAGTLVDHAPHEQEVIQRCQLVIGKVKP